MDKKLEILKKVEEFLNIGEIKKAEDFLKEKLKDFLNLSFKDKLVYSRMRKKNTCFNIENISSVLVVSTHKIKHLFKVLETNASLILFNLEDGVKKEYKNVARLILIYFLLNFEINKPYLIRINKDENFLEDLYLILSLDPFGIRIPKTTKEDIYLLYSLVEKYFCVENFFLGISIESKKALEELEDIFRISKEKFKNVISFLGLYDIKAEMPFLENEFFMELKKYVALKSNFFDIYSIGSAYQNYKDIDGFLKDCIFEKKLGFKAKFCIGPKQVEIANKVFSKDKNILNWARDIIKKFEEKGPYYEDGMFIDEPIYREAKNIVKLFET